MKPQIVMIDDPNRSGKSRKQCARSTNRRASQRGQASRQKNLSTLAVTILSALLVVQLMPRDNSAYPSILETTTRNLQESSRQLAAPSTTTLPVSTTNNKDDFQLAYDQSYGFFDNIASADWKLFQQRARNSPRHANPARPNGRWPVPRPCVFYMNNYDPLFSCAHVRRLGGAGDGPKWTCDPHRLARIAQGRKPNAVENVAEEVAKTDAVATNKPQSNCLVYSFGCAGKYHFEEGLAKLLMGHTGQQQQQDCEIHVFDMVGSNKRTGSYTVPGHVETYNIHFHQWGLKSTYDNGMEKAWPNQAAANADRMFTLEQVMDKLGHTGHVIDILKIDCEFCEWFSYKDWLNPKLDIRQLLIETHNLPTPAENPQTAEGGHWFPISTDLVPNQFFDDIEKAGYAMYSKEPNIHPQAGGNGVEFAYIKLHPDFFRGIA